MAGQYSEMLICVPLPKRPPPVLHPNLHTGFPTKRGRYLQEFSFSVLYFQKSERFGEALSALREVGGERHSQRIIRRRKRKFCWGSKKRSQRSDWVRISVEVVERNPGFMPLVANLRAGYEASEEGQSYDVCWKGVSHWQWLWCLIYEWQLRPKASRECKLGKQESWWDLAWAHTRRNLAAILALHKTLIP